MRGFDAERFALEAATGGDNTLLIDNAGYPSVMARIPMFRWSEVLEGGEDEPCSAFIAGGRVYDCIYVSKYLNIIEDGRAYSLPNRAPAHTLTIDEARAACAAKGRGWHLMSNAEWTAIAHWCVKNGTVPRGNSNFGRDYAAIHERGILVPENNGTSTESEMRIYSGSGPAAWSHDRGPAGIYDLNGNIWDYVSGVRIVDGEIQIIPDNDSALNVDESSGSSYWRAINASGELVTPGSPGTYHYDGTCPGILTGEDVSVGGGFILSDSVIYRNYTGNDPDNAHRAYGFMPFFDMSANVGVHIRLRRLGLFPAETGYRDSAFFFLRNYGERIAARGGSWFDGAGGGIWDLYLRETREFIFPDIGFRAAYINIDSEA